MKIEKFVLGPVGTNCYIVRNEDMMECFIVDVAACPPEFVSHIKNAGLTVKAVLLTHGHFDHIMGLDRFLEEFPVPVYACAAEKELLESAQMNSSAGMLGRPYTFNGAQFVKDGDLLEIAGMKIQVIQTPGHTIRASVGRTDLPTGSMSALVRSVTDRLLVLPDETRVYPGHMEETTVGYEKKYNPFL